MAVVDGKPDVEVAARCRELGIKGFAAFARRYGQRITDLSAERALDILSGTSPSPTDNFPDRWAKAVAVPSRSKEERDQAIKQMHAQQIDEWLTYLRKKDEDDGYLPAATEGGTDTDSQHRRNDRPMFGDPLPTRTDGRPRSAEQPSAFGGMDGG
jgi:hypothetical protein